MMLQNKCECLVNAKLYWIYFFEIFRIRWKAVSSAKFHSQLVDIHIDATDDVVIASAVLRIMCYMVSSLAFCLGARQTLTRFMHRF